MTFVDPGANEYRRKVSADTRHTLALGAISVAIFFCGVGVVIGVPSLIMYRLDLFYAIFVALVGAACVSAGAVLIYTVEYRRDVVSGIGGLALVATGSLLAVAALLYISVSTSPSWSTPDLRPSTEETQP